MLTLNFSLKILGGDLDLGGTPAGTCLVLYIVGNK